MSTSSRLCAKRYGFTPLPLLLYDTVRTMMHDSSSMLVANKHGECTLCVDVCVVCSYAFTI